MKATKSELISRAGVHYAGYIFSLSGLIFRETSSTDVGVDGQLELVTPEGVATGMLVGVQIKSGDSFVNKHTHIFSFKASKDHFRYWQNLCIPSIGIVYSPALRTASWFDLTEQAKIILKNEYSPIIKQTLNNKNIIDIDIGLTQLVSKIYQYYKRPVEIADVEKLSAIQQQENNEIKLTKEESWKRLISIFFSSESDAEVIGKAGYSLSWYFPTVSDEQKNQFKERLNLLSLSELNKIFGAINLALKRDRNDVADLIMDLLSYHPEITSLLDMLDTEGFINSKDRWVLQQLIEYIEQ